MSVWFSWKILFGITAIINTGAVIITIYKHKSLTVEDLLIREKRKILGNNDTEEWNKKIAQEELKEWLTDPKIENLKNKCKQILKTLLSDNSSFKDEENARKWCVK